MNKLFLYSLMAPLLMAAECPAELVFHPSRSSDSFYRSELILVMSNAEEVTQSLAYDELYDKKLHLQRVWNAFRAHPEQVNDSMSIEEFAGTALELAWGFHDVELIREMLKAGAVPFSENGARAYVINERNVESDNEEIGAKDKEIVELIRREREKYNLLYIIRHQRGEKPRVAPPQSPRPGSVGEVLLHKEHPDMISLQRALQLAPEAVNEIVLGPKGITTPLLTAICMNDVQAVRMLLGAGAIPFLWRGDKDILGYAAELVPGLRIAPEIEKSVRLAQREYHLIDLILSYREKTQLGR